MPPILFAEKQVNIGANFCNKVLSFLFISQDISHRGHKIYLFGVTGVHSVMLSGYAWLCFGDHM